MNLSAQDHQTFFTCEADAGKPEYESKKVSNSINNIIMQILFTVMQTAWRERNPEVRIKAAKSAMELNPECASSYI